jgi:pimeloyl-ACP methyl ester carboxylesterase
MMLAQASGWTPPAKASDCSAAQGEAPSMPGAMSRSMHGLCQIGGWTAASDPRVGAQAMEDDMLTDLREEIAAISVPLTVAYAQDTRQLPAERFAAIWSAAYIRAPRARLVPVDGSRHFIMLDQSEVLDREISAFLASD